MNIVSASGLALAFGDVEVFSGIHLEIPDDARIGMIGPNGAGKTSLLRVISGDVEPDGGQLRIHSGLRIGYVPQVLPDTLDGSVRDYVMTAFDDLRLLERRLESSLAAMSHPGLPEETPTAAEYASLLDRFESLGGYSYETRLERVAAGISLTPATLDTPAAAASGGERTRAALARALLSEPDLLVLDEPANYLDLKGIAWLERLLSHFRKAFLVVSHDRYFLDRVVNRIWEMDHERLQSFPGNYTRYRALKGEQIIWQRRRYLRQQEYIAREEAFIRRYGAGQRAREAQGRAKRLARLERVDVPQKDAAIRLASVSAGRTEHVVLRTLNLAVGFVEDGQAHHLLSVPDIQLERASRTAILGDNGSGKTTLLKTILGEQRPLEGSVALADAVDVGYFRQEHDYIPEDCTVFEALLDARNIPLAEVRPYLARFLFRDDEVFQEVSTLSGGQRSRLALARLLINEPNVLVLDEPTTHLDIATREALEKVLLDYDGAIIVVSHDRHFISLIARQLWIVEDGGVTVFPGTYAEWEQQKQAETAPPPRPARIAPKRPATAATKPKPKVRLVKVDLSQVIDELETKLAKIESDLEEASAGQDMPAIVRLGEEHESVRIELEQKWLEWTR